MARASILFLVVCVACLGCMRSPGGIAPSNIPLDQNGYAVLGPVSASDCKVDLLGIIPTSGGNHLSDAIAEVPGDRAGAHALIDITVERVSKYLILWSHGCTIV